MCRTQSGYQLQHSKTCEIIPRVLRPAKNTNQIFDMRGLEKLQPPVFHERDVALAELDFEHVGVVGGAHQHGLVVQGNARFALLEHPFYYIVRLRLLILGRHQRRFLFRAPL